MLKFWKKKPPDADKAAAPTRTDDTVPALAEAPAAAAIDAEAPLAAEPADDTPEAIPARRSCLYRCAFPHTGVIRLQRTFFESVVRDRPEHPYGDQQAMR